VEVHYTVGFCIYIRRAVLVDVGLFDAEHFPVGYGEEADFCYRARRVGWRHVVTGDVFVRHWEGQSFGERKAELMAQMLKVFSSLHPDIGANDRNFEARDPVRPLRESLDLARLKRMLAGAESLPYIDASRAVASPRPALICQGGEVCIAVPDTPTLRNLPVFRLPADIAAFNAALARLGIRRLAFEDRATFSRFATLVHRLPMELGPAAALEIAGAAV
jgi:hypothetical protein